MKRVTIVYLVTATSIFLQSFFTLRKDVAAPTTVPLKIFSTNLFKPISSPSTNNLTLKHHHPKTQNSSSSVNGFCKPFLPKTPSYITVVKETNDSALETQRKTRAFTVIRLLEEEYPEARIALNYSNPLELLVATMLSAQCTDKKVNTVTESLFKKYRKPEDYARANLAELERDIKPTGFYRNKAKNIKQAATILADKFHSKVPKTMDEIMELPGVARKTANIVLQNGYGVVEGVAVDTHVRRVSKRLGLTENEDPNKIERDLMRIIRKDKWMRITDLLIFLGRNVCVAKKPKCEVCVLNKVCPSAFTFK
jgi:endonuclease-3